MDWIKKNPAQVGLMVVALVSLVATGLLATKVLSFKSTLRAVQVPAGAGGKVEISSTGPVDAARKAIDNAAVWEPAKDEGSLFVSRLYVIKDGKLIRPDDPGTMFQPPVPNVWLMKYGLDPLNASVLAGDPDKDGFTTRQEWDGLDGLSHLDATGQPVMGADSQPLPDDSTNPVDPKSHPQYLSRLKLTKVVYFQFRLRFMSYDIDPKNPKNVTVQINTLDRGNRTIFVTLGDEIPGTRFKTLTLERKEVPGRDDTKIDASELTVINSETGVKVVLPLNKVVDSPDTSAVFEYLWVKPGGKETPPFAKRRGERFALEPEADKFYKLIDITGREVVLELPSGEKKTFIEAK